MGEQQEWQALYAAAMLETDTAQLPQRIEMADTAIRARLQQLSESYSVGSEQAELYSALTCLCRLDAA